MYFYNQMFNPQYVNQDYYRQVANQAAQYNYQQNAEVAKVVNAFHDLLESAKKLDAQHQEAAFLACLAEFERQKQWGLI